MKKFIASIATFSLVFAGLIGIQAPVAQAIVSTTVIYDSLPSPLPYNAPSQPFQAQQTYEFGDYVHLAGTDRVVDTVTVAMSDWALYSDYTSDERYSGNPATWSHPITINIYGNHLGENGVPDNLLLTKTQNIDIPWRPAADITCPGGTAWRAADTNCYNGFAFNAIFDLGSMNVTLPNDVIVSLAYNTQTYGTDPIGSNGPYNSLNVLVPEDQPVTVGTDDSASEVFWNTSTAVWYEDDGASGVNTFRKDTNWAPYGTIAMQIKAKVPVVVPTAKVHILKYLDGQQATAESANGFQFPMTATWNAANIGSGTGNYVLGNGHGGADLYGADTAPMSIPASYSTFEIVGGQVVANVNQCAPGKYLLEGYQTSSVSFADAALKTIKKQTPSFPALSSDQYVIVRNKTCPTTGKITGMKYNDLNKNGTKQANEPGLSGWTITLRQGNTVAYTTVTDANGNYEFSNVAPGNYKVREVHQNGWKRRSKNQPAYLVKPGSWFSGINFGNSVKAQNEQEDTVVIDNRDE